MTPTCPGNCCALLTYSGLTHAQVAELKGDPDAAAAAGHDERCLEMLIPIGNDEALDRARRLLPLELADPEVFLDEQNAYFRCAHWDETTRLCTDYDRRPRMCRDYPYGEACRHGCNYRGCRGYPLNPRGERNLAVLTYMAARYGAYVHGGATDLGTA